MGVKVREKPIGSGVYWIFISHNGVRKSKRVGDRKTAEAAARQIEARLTLRDLGFVQGDRQIKTFGEYAKSWIKTVIPATCKESTRRDYQGQLDNHVLPVFKNLRVTEIKRLMVKEFLMKKTNEGYAASTITHMKNVVSGVLNMAIDDETIVVNPARRAIEP